MFGEIFISILCALVLYIYYHYKAIHWKFESSGLKFKKGLPLFGNTWRSTFEVRHGDDDYEEIYRAFPGERYVGFMKSMKPVILIRDPQLMKNILIKDFQHFSNRKVFPERFGSLMSKTVAGIGEEKWKALREQQIPAFTSNKLKFMIKKMDEIAQEVVNRLKDHVSEDLDLSLNIHRYCAEAAMYAAIGVRDSKDKKNLENIFLKVGLMIAINPFSKALYFTSTQFPRLGMILKLVGFKLFPKKSQNFFIQTTKAAIEHRKESHVNSQDYLQVLTQMSDEWTIEEISAQVFFTFTASFNATANNLCFLFLELAVNPDIEEKLYQEIIRYTEVKGDLTLDGLRELKYMNCVVNESLRKYAPTSVMDRICSKPYLLPPPREGGKPCLVKPGDYVYCVSSILHKDPNYFPKPEVFDPERFSDENKHNIQPGTFVPFGMGPRGCIAERFARTLMSLIIYHMVLNFKILKCAKTSDPIRIEPDEFSVRSLGGSWVRLEAR